MTCHRRFGVVACGIPLKTESFTDTLMLHKGTNTISLIYSNAIGYNCIQLMIRYLNWNETCSLIMVHISVFLTLCYI